MLGVLLVAAPLRPVTLAQPAGSCQTEAAEAGTNPKDEFAWIGLGRCYLQANLLDQAIDAFRTAAELNGAGTIVALDYLGAVYVRQGRLQQARDLYRQVEEHGLQTADHQGWGDEYFERGDLDKAAEEYRHSIVLGYFDSGTLDRARDIGLRYMAGGVPEKAQEILALIFERRPTDEKILEALQALLRRNGREDEASILHFRYMIALYKGRYNIAAGALRDDLVTFHIRLGELYAKLGRLDQAQQVLEEAVELNHDLSVALAVEARVLLGDVYCRSHQAEKAIAQWTRVLQLDPANTAATDRLERARREGC